MAGAELTVFSDYKSMCKKTAEEIADDLKKNPRQMLCIAAGHTSIGVLEELVSMYQNAKVDFSQASFVAMDEWTQMNADTEGSCGWFLNEHFLKKVNYQKEKVFLWNGKSEDYEFECKKAQAFIEAHTENDRIDYLVLGVGMNGHLALNEPGTELDSRAHVTLLDTVTAKVGQKYFKNNISLQGGLTLGLADFGEANRIVLLVNGEKKGSILKQIRMTNSFDIKIPATAVHVFENAAIYSDMEAMEASKTTI